VRKNGALDRAAGERVRHARSLAAAARIA